ncbi:MAG: hypothetical protein Q6M54_00655 [Thermostichus sp. DRC_bins_24]
MLKENIAADEYQRLVNRKRSAARRKDSGEEEVAESTPQVPSDPPADPAPGRSRTRRRSSSLQTAEAQQQVLPLDPQPSSSPPSIEPIAAADNPASDPTDDEAAEIAEELPAEDLELVAELQADLEDGEEEEDEDETDEDGDLEDEEDDEDDDSDYFLEDGPGADSLADSGYSFQVLPLEELIPPETCYAVVDRYQELATRPLKEFLNLGSGSLPETIRGLDGANTLPIFDNHKVARRFSEMSRRGSNTYPPYRVIQFPGHILEAVRTQLQNKGITHLLMDGQIYAL